MNLINDDHPNDDVLIAYAVNGYIEDMKEHVDSCPSCSRYVKEINTIKHTLKSLPDEEVPENLRAKIMHSVKNSNSYLNQWFNFECTTWYKNPLIVGVGSILAVIFLYIFFVFIL